MSLQSNKEQLQLHQYGITEAELLASKPKKTDDLSYGMAILSDAQAVLGQGHSNEGRQFINRAKFFILRAIKSNKQLYDFLLDGMKDSPDWDRIKEILEKHSR